MSRNISASFISAITATSVKVRLLAYFDFPAGELRLWSGIGNLSWNSETWTGAGTLLNFSPPKTGTDLSSASATFSLSGASASILSAALAADYQNRACEAYFAVLDAADAVIATPYKFQGRMDMMDIVDSPEQTVITLTAESRLIDFERPRIRRYSNQDQQDLYAGDVGLEFASVMPNLKISWGDPNAQRTVPVRPPAPKTSA